MIAWFSVPYKRDLSVSVLLATRYCAMNDFTNIIRADGGDWAETEVLGNRAIVKVRASKKIIDDIEKMFYRYPKDNLQDLLLDITLKEEIDLNAEIKDKGYSDIEKEIDLGTNTKFKTLGEVLNFETKRRLKPRYDSKTDEIILDGPEQTCRSIFEVDNQIK